MSFMKTCVLAKRWRHLWHSVPGLDIDFDEFKRPSCADDNKKHKDRDKYKDWEDFTANVMLRCTVGFIPAAC
jgi:hypothetical protein